MVQVAKPMGRLGLRFARETRLCFAEVIHTCPECSHMESAHGDFAGCPCGPSPWTGPSTARTTMTAPTRAAPPQSQLI
jgi:hypothetical protein